MRGVSDGGVRVRAFGCAAVSIVSNASSGGDDLVGIAETFKCLREELLRRA
jgi:hypothetical protein